jgi:hypothetical protein
MHELKRPPLRRVCPSSGAILAAFFRETAYSDCNQAAARSIARACHSRSVTM